MSFPFAGDGNAHEQPFRFALLDHLFVVRALILRDLRLRHKDNGRLGFFNEFYQPIVAIILHYYLFIFMNRYMPARIPVELYVLGGFTTWFVFREVSVRNIIAVENERGFISLPRVALPHVLAAAAIWQMLTCSVMLCIGLGICVLAFGGEPLPNVPLSIAAFFVSALLGVGYKLLFDGLGLRWKTVKGLKGPITFLLFLTSGIYFGSTGPKTSLLDQIVSYNPLFHALEPQRRALWPGYPVAGISMLYAITWALGLMLVGLLLKRWLRSRPKSQ